MEHIRVPQKSLSKLQSKTIVVKLYSRSSGPPFLHCIFVKLRYFKYHSVSDETPRLTMASNFFAVKIALFYQ